MFKISKNQYINIKNVNSAKIIRTKVNEIKISFTNTNGRITYSDALASENEAKKILNSISVLKEFTDNIYINVDNVNSVRILRTIKNKVIISFIMKEGETVYSEEFTDEESAYEYFVSNF